MTTLANSANSHAHAHASASTWHRLAERILNGHSMTRDEGLAVLRSDDCELLDLLSRISQADIPKYKLLDADEILDGA